MDITTGIVRILDPIGQTIGTGFVLTDDGLIATCAHVVESAGAGPGKTVGLVFHHTSDEATATVEPDRWSESNAEDVAILRLKGRLPKGVLPLPLGNSAEVEGQTFYTFGFPDSKSVEGVAGKCEVIGRTKSLSE